MSMNVSMGRPMTATTSSIAREVEHQQENHELHMQQKLLREKDEQHRQNHQFSCLYTHQKNKKRKTWQDGKFVLQSRGHGMLYIANPPPGSGNPCLAEVELPPAEFDLLLRRHQTLVESEKYLIQLEEIWSEPTSNLSQTSASAKPIVSNGMQKLLTKKFQKPCCFVPPNPSQSSTSRAASNLARRRKPLQPGELVRQHYGSEAATSITDEKSHLTQHLNTNTFSAERIPPNFAPSTMPVQPQILQNGQQRQQQVYPSAETHSATTSHQQPRLPQNNSRNSGWADNYANFPSGQLTLATVKPQMQQETQRKSNSFVSTTHQQPPISAIQNHPQPLTSSTKALQQFARNSFDPSQFYGFEEDDDDDEEDSGNGQHFVGGEWFAPHTTNTDKGDNDTCNDTNSVPRHVTPTGDQDCPSFQTIVLPDKTYVPKTDTAADTADVGVASSSNTMTDADLLDLFGGSDSFQTQSHDDDKQQENNVELNEEEENVESTRVSCPEQIGGWTLAVEDREGRNASTNRKAHKDTNADDEFVLPPSESSSDESSDDESQTKLKWPGEERTAQ